MKMRVEYSLTNHINEMKGAHTFVTHSIAFSEIPVFFTSAISSGMIMPVRIASKSGRVVVIL